MTRYFVDTGPLLGVTFLHDLWYDESERLFNTDNTLYTSDTVIYEYCNYEGYDFDSIEADDIDLESENGRFGRILTKVRLAQRSLDIGLRSYDDEELDLETLLDEFINEAGIEEEIYPEKLIDERIRPNLRNFLIDRIEGREITREVAREVMDNLCDEIETEARGTKEMIEQRVNEAPERRGDWSEKKDRLHFIDNRLDKEILCDAANMDEKRGLGKVVTTDGNHIYDNRKRIDTVLGLNIVFIKDEFAGQAQSPHAESNSVNQETG